MRPIKIAERGPEGDTEKTDGAERQAEDEAGKEFHYKVSAITALGKQYLVFQLDPGSDRMREVLQKIRSEALSAERDRASHDAVAAQMRMTNQDAKELLQQLLLSNPTVEQREQLNALAAKFVAIMGSAGKLIRSTVPHV